MNPVVSELFIYPVKSAGEIATKSAHVDRFGLNQDRRWMLIDADGKFVTQRTHSQLVFLGVSVNEAGITLSWPNAESLNVLTPNSTTAKGIQVQVWNDQCNVLDAGDTAAAWLSELLEQPIRLVFMPDDYHRLIPPKFASNQQTVSFADAFPLLMTTQASLGDLNGRLDDAVEMLRFRPNIVLTGASAFSENDWKRIRIGEVDFVVTTPCERCIVTTINPDTGKQGKEPLATLAKYRKINNKVIFGANLLHMNEGKIGVGDEVEILE